MRDPLGIQLNPKKIVSPKSKIFCLGSCFAVELKKVLQSKNYSVFPNVSSFDQTIASKASTEPNDLDFVHYNSYTILQEFKNAIGLSMRDPEDLWKIVRNQNGSIIEGYRDPYRKKVWHDSKHEFQSICQEYDRIAKEGIFASDVFILTYSITEVWKNGATGKIACTKGKMKFAKGSKDLELYISSFEENYRNIKEVVDLILKLNPKAQIILTVSPMHLERTFRDEHIYVASTEGKAIMRTAIGQLSREYERVTYFPSYEISQILERFAEFEVLYRDGRHFTPEAVEFIMNVFFKTHS